MTEDMLAIFIVPIMLFGIPAIIHSFRRVERNERREIRQQYTDLIKEKLDVIRTALAMGRDDDEIAELDRRLERLIGTEKMLNTLKNPTSDAVTEAQYLASKDIVEELDRNHERSKKRQDA